MAYYCWVCGNEQYFDVKAGVKVGRHDECPHCGAELRCCKNCSSYDLDVHDQCRESAAEFIRDRERANFCGHFAFRNATAPRSAGDPVDSARARLEAMFKKLR